MEVEYGIGVTNRYAFFYDKDDAEEAIPAPKEPTPVKSAKNVDLGIGKAAPQPKKGVPSKDRGDHKGTDLVGRNNIKNLKSEDFDRTYINGSVPRRGGDRNGSKLQQQQPRAVAVDRKGPGTRGGRPDKDRHLNEPKGDEANPEEGVAAISSDAGDGRSKEEDDNKGKAESEDQAGAAEKEKGEDGEKKPESEEEEEEKPVFTLAQWKEMQAPREKPNFNIRKPGEGEKALGKLIPRKKEEEEILDELDHEEHYEHVKVYYPQRVGRQKVISDVGFRCPPRRRFPRFPKGVEEEKKKDKDVVQNGKKEETKDGSEKKEETKSETEKKEETKGENEKKEETKGGNEKEEETKGGNEKKEETSDAKEKKVEDEQDKDKKVENNETKEEKPEESKEGATNAKAGAVSKENGKGRGSANRNRKDFDFRPPYRPPELDYSDEKKLAIYLARMKREQEQRAKPISPTPTYSRTAGKHFDRERPRRNRRSPLPNINDPSSFPTLGTKEP